MNAPTRPSIPGVRPLLLSGSYTPTPTVQLGQRGRHAVCVCGEHFRHMGVRGKLPKLGPCCRGKMIPKSPTAPKVDRPVLHPPAPRRHFTPSELLQRITRPGCAVIAFEGGVTLFTGGRHFQAPTLAEAMDAAESGERDAPLSQSGAA